MIQATITYTPRLSPAEQQLAALPNRLRNLRPMFDTAIVPLAEAMLTEHWDSKGARFGHAWPALAESTIAARTRKGTIAKGILRDADDLFHAVFRSLRSSRALQSVAGGVRLVMGESAIDDPLERAKFRFHMRGTSRMPVRQPIPSPLPRSFREQVRAVVHSFIATGRVRGAGGRFVSLGRAGSTA